MSISPVGDSLQIVPGGVIHLIDGDIVEKNIGEISTNIVQPIYGEPYIIIQGVKTSKYRSNSLKFVAPLSTFQSLDSHLVSGVFPIVTCMKSGTPLFTGIMTSISYSIDLSIGNESVTGQITYITTEV